MAMNKSTTGKLIPPVQMAVFWRILHLMTSQYGNYPMGQLLVALTMIVLNERGKPPTQKDLCEATGLPKASVSRYVSWQLREGLCEEQMDVTDRRRRLLVQTSKGKAEWEWQLSQLEQIFSEMSEVQDDILNKGSTTSAAELLDFMKNLSNKVSKKRMRSHAAGTSAPR